MLFIQCNLYTLPIVPTFVMAAKFKNGITELYDLLKLNLNLPSSFTSLLDYTYSNVKVYEDRRLRERTTPPPFPHLVNLNVYGLLLITHL